MWPRHVLKKMTVRHLQQFVTVWEFAQNVQLDASAPDKIIWNWTANGEYSASSAYQAQFIGSEKLELKPLIWKPWAPQKCKFFAWLVTKNRVWTSDRLAVRGWPRNEVCHFARGNLKRRITSWRAADTRSMSGRSLLLGLRGHS